MTVFSISPQCYNLFICPPSCNMHALQEHHFNDMHDHLLVTCYVQFLRRSRLKMELSYFISLILIFLLNVLFFFTGICLNSLAILTFWRSVQLRKKLCYFMIMVLSCCDLLVVLTNHPFNAVIGLLFLTGKLDAYPNWVVIFLRFSVLYGFSLLVLLVMNIDRYLATYYPIFHRTSVTKGKLLTLLSTLIVGEIALYLMYICGRVISYPVFVLIFFIIIIPPMLFVNYKLFIIARKSRRNNGISSEMKKTFSLKNISSCLLAIACFVLLSIPTFVYIGLRINSGFSWTLGDTDIAGLWATTITSMNSTCNCLIFYWKNKILRTEGMKLIKGFRIRQKDES